MPSPTVAQIHTRFNQAATIAWEALDGLATNLPTPLDNLLSGTSTVNAAAQGDAGERFLQAAAGLLGAPAANLFAWTFFDYALTGANLPAANLADAIRITIDYFVDNNLTVKSRGINFGTASAGAGNAGDGIPRRQLVDENGQEIEACSLETKTLTCVADARIGRAGTTPAVNREFFEIKGQPRDRYGLTLGGSGITTLVRVLDILSDDFLSDPLFTGGTFATAPSTGSPQAPTALGDWTAADISKITADVDALPRTLPVSGVTAHKIVFGNDGTDADNTITQLAEKWVGTFANGVPVHAEVWLRRRSSVAGTAKIVLGSQETTVDVTTLTNDVWYRLELSDGTDAKNWPKVWNQGSTTFAVDLSGSSTTGTLEVAFPLLAAMEPVDGTGIVMLPGLTPFAFDDSFTIADALDGTDSKIQQLLVRALGVYLPHTADATQVAASGGRTLTFAAAGKTITASTGSFITDGYALGMRVTGAGTSSNNGDLGLITNITATVLTVDGTLVNEGPLSSTATVDAAATITEPT